VIDFDTRSFESQHGNTIYVPALRLKDWVLWDDQPVPAARPVTVPIESPAAPVVKALPQPKRAPRDMDDDLPF
jgi:hypothetical protein